MKDDIQFYQTEFPRTFNDFVYLAREFTRAEIGRCDKDGLIELCVELKRKELEYYIDRNLLQNELDSRSELDIIKEYVYDETRVRALAEIYKKGVHEAAMVATICDDVIDRSGKLLGDVRNIVRNEK